MNIPEIIGDFVDIVDKVESVETIEEEGVAKAKLKIRLFDGTKLWIREVQVDGALIAYSYYWLRADNSLIMGWDNAPHHPEISTFPHHKHVGKEIETSHETDIRKVLAWIGAFYG